MAASYAATSVPAGATKGMETAIGMPDCLFIVRTELPPTAISSEFVLVFRGRVVGRVRNADLPEEYKRWRRQPLPRLSDKTVEGRVVGVELVGGSPFIGPATISAVTNRGGKEGFTWRPIGE